MTSPDVNLLVHAYNLGSPFHTAARSWWEETLGGTEPVGLGWVAIMGFVRISTNRRILTHPLAVDVACQIVRSWLAHPPVSILHPGPRHAAIFLGFLEGLGAGANLTTDAHLAALAVERGAVLCSTDSDFAKFPGLVWVDPLKAR